MKEPQRPPVHLDTAEQIEALLEAAADLDRNPRFHCIEREAILATLVFAGPRAHELCNLLWRDVDLANGRISIGRSKTPAGLREITMLPILRDILAAHKAAAYRSGSDDLVFPSGTGGRRDKGNLRTRVLLDALKRADEILESRGLIPLPRGLTPHKLRHTFASILIACGEDPISVMKQLGHTDPGFTLRVYSHLMSRDAKRAQAAESARAGRAGAGQGAAATNSSTSPPTSPIMRALADRGGRASRKEIVEAVGKAMAAATASAISRPWRAGHHAGWRVSPRQSRGWCGAVGSRPAGVAAASGS